MVFASSCRDYHILPEFSEHTMSVLPRINWSSLLLWHNLCSQDTHQRVSITCTKYQVILSIVSYLCSTIPRLTRSCLVALVKHSNARSPQTQIHSLVHLCSSIAQESGFSGLIMQGLTDFMSHSQTATLSTQQVIWERDENTVVSILRAPPTQLCPIPLPLVALP